MSPVLTRVSSGQGFSSVATYKRSFIARSRGGVTAGRSVRFNAPDTAYLSRTPASEGNRRTATLSFWVKKTRYVPGTNDIVFGASSTFVYFDGNTGGLRVQSLTGSSFDITTPGTYRDFSAWSHFVVAFDLNNATSTDRIKIYHNGVLVHNGTATSADFPLNSITEHTIGATAGGGQPASFYLALVHWIDGQALTPSSFGETSATTGQWIAKTYSGTYGTNGFFLDFSDNSAATATTLGKDKAGNNNWTPNNLSVTAGSNNDSLRDHPTSTGTSTGLGGEVAGNYCTWNPLKSGSDMTLSNGNLQATGSAANPSTLGTIGVSSGKWYWEITVATFANMQIGIAKDAHTVNSYLGGTANSWSMHSNGNKYTSGSSSSYGSSYTTNDVIGVAFDADNGTLTFYKNNVSQGTAFTGLTSGPYFPGFSYSDPNPVIHANFGQRAFTYAAPAGFSPLVDTLLSTPTIALSNQYVGIVTYTGNGGSGLAIRGFGFQPDMVWLKNRTSSTGNNDIFDSVRQESEQFKPYVRSNSAIAEASADGVLEYWYSDGFQMANGSTVNNFNNNNQNYVCWAWDAGSSSTSTNNTGSIQSSLKANSSSGFSVVTWNGAGSLGTVGHSLGAKPGLILFKNRSANVNWRVYHSGVGANTALLLNSTSTGNSDTGYFNNTEPTSSVFTVNDNDEVNGITNGSQKMLAYCWAPVSGFSAFGQYTGNGSTNGPFIYTGFRPKIIWFKCISAVSNWIVFDSERSKFNVVDRSLFPNLGNEESVQTTNLCDLLSNGFKLRETGNNTNSSGGTFIYCAWAESPFQYSRAR